MSDTKKCPFCAEEIKIEAKICRYCNCILDEAVKEKTITVNGTNLNKEALSLKDSSRYKKCALVIVGILLSLLIGSIINHYIIKPIYEETQKRVREEREKTINEQLALQHKLTKQMLNDDIIGMAETLDKSNQNQSPTPIAIKGQITVTDVMKLADEHGQTLEEKYGNAIFASTLLSSSVLMEFGTALMDIEKENFREVIPILEKNKTNLEEIATEVKAFEVPRGYEGVQKKVLSYYTKIFEGVDNAIKGIDKNDAKAMAAFNTNMGEATKVVEEAMKELAKKGYKPTEEFQKVVFGMFEQPGSKIN